MSLDRDIDELDVDFGDPDESAANPLGGMVVQEPVPSPSQPNSPDHNRDMTLRFPAVRLDNGPEPIVPMIWREFDDVERHPEAAPAGRCPLQRKGMSGGGVRTQVKGADARPRDPGGAIEREHRPTVEIAHRDDHEIFGSEGWRWSRHTLALAGRYVPGSDLCAISTRRATSLRDLYGPLFARRKHHPLFSPSRARSLLGPDRASPLDP
jgi:hypothetical protein